MRQASPTAVEPQASGHSAECHHPLRSEQAGVVPVSA
jgi:hypothetical protein